MTSVDPSPRRVWQAARMPLLVGLFVLLAALAIAVVGSQRDRGLLDPRAVDPTGSRALAELLAEQDVRVDLVRTAEQARHVGPETTLLVAFPDRLAEPQLAALRDTPADLVLVAPGRTPLQVLAPGVEPIASAAVQIREPNCTLPAARAAGAADTGGDVYRAAAAGQRCYPAEQGPTLVQLGTDGRTLTVIGTARPFTNEALDEAGNAALTLRLLGAHPRLVWYLPSLVELPAGQRRPFLELIPAGWLWGAAQVGLGVLLLALWRARRLGPVVAEPLPVVVRGAETVEGRARLYRRAGARDRAAGALRAAMLRRLLPLLGLPRRAEPTAVVAAVAARAGRAPSDVEALLYGAAPPDDVGLVRLADGLDTVEREVRRS